MTRNSLTQARLKEVINYCSDTGVLTWLGRPMEDFSSVRVAKVWNKRFAGKRIESPSKHVEGSYFRASVDRISYYAHRLAWFYVHGEWPEQIDHINHNRSDNRLCNLRSVTNSVNGKNTKIHATNKSGIMGVRFNKDRWHVQMHLNQKTKWVGAYSDFFEACCARKSAENALNYHPNHGAVA